MKTAKLQTWNGQKPNNPTKLTTPFVEAIIKLSQFEEWTPYRIAYAFNVTPTLVLRIIQESKIDWLLNEKSKAFQLLTKEFKNDKNWYFGSFKNNLRKLHSFNDSYQKAHLKTLNPPYIKIDFVINKEVDAEYSISHIKFSLKINTKWVNIDVFLDEYNDVVTEIVSLIEKFNIKEAIDVDGYISSIL